MPVSPTPDELNKLRQRERKMDLEDPDCYNLTAEGTTARSRRRAAEEMRAILAMKMGIFPAQFAPWLKEHYDPEFTENFKHCYEVVCKHKNPYCIRPLHLVLAKSAKPTRFTLTPLYPTYNLSEEEEATLLKRWIRGLP